jgi:hypothetical protein
MKDGTDKSGVVVGGSGKKSFEDSNASDLTRKSTHSN